MLALVQNALAAHNIQITKHLNSNTLLVILVTGISVFSYGFDTGILDTIQAMDYFETQFGNSKGVISAAHLAYLNSFPLILYAVGVVLASRVGEAFGRRIVFVLMNCICMAGVAIAYTATTFPQILAGRMIVMMHVGMEAWLVPLWLAEMVPSAIRGSVVTSYTFNHIFATFISSIISKNTSGIKGNNSWRIPIACMFIFPALALLFSPCLPESPRWLLRKDRREAAAKSLYFLNGSDGAYVAEDEVQVLRDALDHAEEKGTWKDLVKGTNLSRLINACICASALQLTGQSFASTYGTIFIKSINVMDAFTATLIKRGLLCLGPLFAMFMVDRWGRRVTLFSWGGLSAASLLTMGALGCVKPTAMPIQKGIVAMAIFFPVCYIASFASIMTTMTSEIPHITLRDKSMMVSWSVANLCNFLASYTLPYLLNAPYANLGSKVAFIYGSLSVAYLIWAFFYMPELTGLSLEEVDEIFLRKVPARKTKGYRSTLKAERFGELGKGNEDVLANEEVTHIEAVQNKTV